MKAIPIILFILGLSLEVGAFFVGNAQHFPWLFRVLSPAYHNASLGIGKLNSDKLLDYDDNGFKEISQLFKKIAFAQNPPDEVNSLSVIKFVQKGAYLGFSTNHAREVIPVEVLLSDGQTVKWNMDDVIRNVEGLQLSSLLKYAAVIFSAGVIIQIFGFILERVIKQTST